MTSSVFNKIRKHLLQYYEKQNAWASAVKFDGVQITNEKEIKGKRAAASRAYNNAYRLKTEHNMESGLWLQLLNDALNQWKNGKK